jgi:putative membrane protein
VAPAAEAFTVLNAVLPTVPAAGPDAIGLHPAPPQARRRAPFQFRRLGYAVTDSALVTRGGWLTARHDVALYARAQSVRISQGPWQRSLGLASVHLDPAGGHTTPTVLHQETAQAARVAADLVDRARAHRAPVGVSGEPAAAGNDDQSTVEVRREASESSAPEGVRGA